MLNRFRFDCHILGIHPQAKNFKTRFNFICRSIKTEDEVTETEIVIETDTPLAWFDTHFFGYWDNILSYQWVTDFVWRYDPRKRFLKQNIRALKYGCQNSKSLAFVLR